MSPRGSAPDHRVTKVRRFANGNPPGTILPCIVHEMSRREDGSACYREIRVRVEILRFRFNAALIVVERLDTGEKLPVDVGWLEEALRS